MQKWSNEKVKLGHLWNLIRKHNLNCHMKYAKSSYAMSHWENSKLTELITEN